MIRLCSLIFVSVEYIVPGSLEEMRYLAIVRVELTEEVFVVRQRSRQYVLLRVAKHAAKVQAKTVLLYIFVDIRLHVFLHPLTEV